MDKNILVLEYQNNFADNFSNLAYAKLLESKYPLKSCFENQTIKRSQFEKLMNNFKFDCSFISSSRVNDISKKTRYMDLRDFRYNKRNQNSIISIPYFKISDADLITNETKKMFDFKNFDFIKNYDILEEIKTTNSIGIYVSSYDNIDNEYVLASYERLNKYLKKPILYIFTSKDVQLNSGINYKIFNLSDWREEFYFLRCCRHKIIHCTNSSYSEGFWASILGNSNNFNYVVYNKNLKQKEKFNNWIAV